MPLSWELATSIGVCHAGTTKHLQFRNTSLMSQRHGRCVRSPHQSFRSLSASGLTDKCPSGRRESWPSRKWHPLAYDYRLLDQRRGDSCTRCNHIASFREFPSSRALTKLCI
ncbi:uncharacterized protein M421DRAFT_320202 [Didymella exigua CBS 183.55]|uniref:Uncharacterized protein n=1 Tax=Didymella exigua CBS 183.55 TaxID=1150837 RepID=A0A6A5RW30_9PLEO|nr:uncharacterized protein M421DRAFT_320202 [Didymella exigua CBS 183.55]KAF1931763.1 hypothetical protein M421DRAFT_320202 [Didymella exigua CBS 183.55]